MNRLKKVFILLLLVSTIQAQQWCEAISIDGDFEVKEMPLRAKTVITIPVVVHVIWSKDEEKVSDEQIMSQIEVLNRDFRALNTDLDQVTLALYQNVVADMEINFELAETNCQGQPETGIIKQKVSPTFWENSMEGNRRKICHDDLNGSSAWCTSCYLNIWVVKQLGIPAAAGDGTFPFELGDNEGDVPFNEDGVYIRYDRFGTIGTVTEPYHLGRTATHEIGHYLNLFHLWGANDPGTDCNPTDCCNIPDYDDFVEDTEFQIKTYLNQCPTGLQLSCGLLSNYQNFMGYSDDPCLVMFTEGQKARVWDALMTYRPGLLNPDCITTPTDEPTHLDNWVENIWMDGSYLKMDIKATPLYCQFYDMQGRLILEWTTTDIGLQEQLLPRLPSGIYLLRIKRESQFLVKKIAIF